MLSNNPFYFSLIKKYVSLFGTLFNDIYVNRTDPTGASIKLIRVPITYSAKQKVLVRIDQDPSISRQSAITLPIMSFEINSVAYDAARKLPSTGKTQVVNVSSTKSLNYQYNPVPYNLGFSLYVYVKNAEDASKIIEQILPFFTPDWTPTVSLIPEMGVNKDI